MKRPSNKKAAEDSTYWKIPSRCKPMKSEFYLPVLGMEFRVQLKTLQEVHGETSTTHRTIDIQKSDPSPVQWLTLIHEAFHAALHINGLGNVLGTKVEESIVQTMEHTVEELLAGPYGEQLLEAARARRKRIS